MLVAKQFYWNVFSDEKEEEEVETEAASSGEEDEDGKSLAQSLKSLISKPTKTKKEKNTPTQDNKETKKQTKTKTPVIAKQQSNNKKPESKSNQKNQNLKKVPEKPLDPKVCSENVLNKYYPVSALSYSVFCSYTLMASV